MAVGHGRARATVTSRGPAVTPAALKALFQPFRRPGAEGTGDGGAALAFLAHLHRAGAR
jgi:signal transduction histidine kinase